MRRPPLIAAISLLVSLVSLSTRAAEPVLLPLAAAQRDAREILTLLSAAIAAPDSIHPSLGATLAAYAKNTGTEPTRYENFEESSRRILAGRPATQISPDATSLRLATLADSILETLRQLEAVRADLRPEHFAAIALGLRAVAHLAHYHAHRILAAVRYSLFLRGQSLAELYAATLETKTTLATWRELVALLGDRESLSFGVPSLTLRGAWRAELTRLEFDYKDLEAMCCPPDESWLRVKVWTPATP